MGSEADAAARARTWHHARHDAICDVLEPWAHGTVARATRHPSYYNFNLVRVEDDPGMSVDALVAFADEALAGLAHRRFDFDLVDVAEPLRAEFEASGWKATRLLMMRRESAAPGGLDIAVEEVPYDAAHDLRVAWHREDFPGQEETAYHDHAREIALTFGARVLAVHGDGAPVAFAEVVRDGAAAEITSVYVHPDHRGAGLGTAITRAAIEAVGPVRDLWIGADDEARAKDLYARLGFRPVWTSMELTRLP